MERIKSNTDGVPVIYLHTAGGHAGRLVKDLELVPARSEGVVADEVLQGRLLQPAGAEGGAAVGVPEDGVAARRTLRGGLCRSSRRDDSTNDGTHGLTNSELWTASVQLDDFQHKLLKFQFQS